MPRTSGTWTKGNPPPTAFKPGQSGNPGGRKPVILLEAAQDLTQVALDRLKFLVDHADDQRVQLDAASEILNRGWGRPAQALSIDARLTHEIGGVDRPPVINESDAEWLERRRAELQALEFERKQPQNTQHASTEPAPTLIDAAVAVDASASEQRH